jgi:hypothetical protein
VSAVLRLLATLLRNIPVSLLTLLAKRIAAGFRERSVAIQADDEQPPPKRPPVDGRA